MQSPRGEPVGVILDQAAGSNQGTVKTKTKSKVHSRNIASTPVTSFSVLSEEFKTQTVSFFRAGHKADVPKDTDRNEASVRALKNGNDWKSVAHQNQPTHWSGVPNAKPCNGATRPSRSVLQKLTNHSESINSGDAQTVTTLRGGVLFMNIYGL